MWFSKESIAIANLLCSGMTAEKLTKLRANWFLHSDDESLASAVGVTVEDIRRINGEIPELPAVRRTEQGIYVRKGRRYVLLGRQELRRYRMKSIGVPATSTNALAGRLEKSTTDLDEGVLFAALTAEQHRSLELRVQSVVAQCVEIACDTWSLGDFNPHIRIDLALRRSRSRGGIYRSRWRTELRQQSARRQVGAGINIAAAKRINLEGPDIFAARPFREYGHLRPFGDIGETTSYSPLDVVVVHEMAHAVHFHRLHVTKDESIQNGALRQDSQHVRARLAPHGHAFCTIYGTLRAALGLIEADKPLFSSLTQDKQVEAVGANYRVKPLGRPEKRPKGTEHLSKEQYKAEMNRRRQAAYRERKRAEKAAGGVD